MLALGFLNLRACRLGRGTRQLRSPAGPASRVGQWHKAYLAACLCDLCFDPEQPCLSAAARRPAEQQRHALNLTVCRRGTWIPLVPHPELRNHQQQREGPPVWTACTHHEGSRRSYTRGLPHVHNCGLLILGDHPMWCMCRYVQAPSSKLQASGNTGPRLWKPERRLAI